MRLSKTRGTIRKNLKNLLLEEEAPVALLGCGSPRRTGESDRPGPKIRPRLTLSLTGVGTIGPSLPYMQISLKVLKVRYRQKLGIPQAGS
jgi:hypothetical protein